jgi:hypothetical protein
VDDRVASGAEARSRATAEGWPGARRELEMELGRDRDVGADRGLERAAVRNEGIDSHLGLDLLCADGRGRCTRRHEANERTERQPRSPHQAFARWRLSSRV